MILLREIGIFLFLIYVGFRTIQHMSGSTWLLLRRHDPTFTKTAHTYALQNTLQPSFSAWYFTLIKMHDTMGQVGQTCKNDDFLFILSIRMTVILPKCLKRVERGSFLEEGFGNGLKTYSFHANTRSPFLEMMTLHLACDFIVSLFHTHAFSTRQKHNFAYDILRTILRI